MLYILISRSNDQVHIDETNECVTDKIPKWNEMRQINSHSVAILSENGH